MMYDNSRIQSSLDESTRSKFAEPTNSAYYKLKSGLQYFGEVKNGKFHGEGSLIYDNHFVFKGAWRYGMPNGQGRITFHNNEWIEAHLNNGEFRGFGIQCFPSRVEYHGTFAENKRNGKGVLVFPQDSVVFNQISAHWSNNSIHGRAILNFKYPGKYSMDIMFDHNMATVPTQHCLYCQQSPRALNMKFCSWIFDSDEGIILHEEGSSSDAKCVDKDINISIFDHWTYCIEQLKHFYHSCNLRDGLQIGNIADTIDDVIPVVQTDQKKIDLINSPSQHGSLGQLQTNHKENISADEQYSIECETKSAQSFAKLYNYLQFATYKGDHQKNHQHGYGILKFSDESFYQGYWHLDKPHGKGIYTNTKLNVTYEGSWDHGHISGSGILTYSDGSRYIGTLKNGLANGQGIMHYSDGSKYEGFWYEGKGHDAAIYTTNTMAIYKLTWLNGVATSVDATIHDPVSNVTYQGQLKNGFFHGKGSCSFHDGLIFEGTWDEGYFQGIIQMRQETIPSLGKKLQYAKIKQVNNRLILWQINESRVPKKKNLLRTKNILNQLSESKMMDLRNQLQHDFFLTEFYSRYPWRPVVQPMPDTYRLSRNMRCSSLETHKGTYGSAELNQDEPSASFSTIPRSDSDLCLLKSVCTRHYVTPAIRPVYKDIHYKMIIPRFVEVPIPESVLDTHTLTQCRRLQQKFQTLRNSIAESQPELIVSCPDFSAGMKSSICHSNLKIAFDHFQCIDDIMDEALSLLKAVDRNIVM